jgi:hypothetical protein
VRGEQFASGQVDRRGWAGEYGPVSLLEIIDCFGGKREPFHYTFSAGAGTKRYRERSGGFCSFSAAAPDGEQPPFPSSSRLSRLPRLPRLAVGLAVGRAVGPERSAMEGSAVSQPPLLMESNPLPFVIPSAAEGSAVPRTLLGNVFRPLSVGSFGFPSWTFGEWRVSRGRAY